MLALRPTVVDLPHATPAEPLDEDRVLGRGCVLTVRKPWCAGAVTRRRQRLHEEDTERVGARAEYRVLIARTLASLTRLLGAKLGANDHRHRATSGHVQPLSLQLDDTSGHIQHRPSTLRKCLLSSRSRVRVAVGAPSVQFNRPFRNYSHRSEVLPAGSYSSVMRP
jgi:hypothetical protein